MERLIDSPLFSILLAEDILQSHTVVQYLFGFDDAWDDLAFLGELSKLVVGYGTPDGRLYVSRSNRVDTYPRGPSLPKYDKNTEFIARRRSSIFRSESGLSQTFYNSELAIHGCGHGGYIFHPFTAGNRNLFLAHAHYPCDTTGPASCQSACVILVDPWHLRRD